MTPRLLLLGGILVSAVLGAGLLAGHFLTRPSAVAVQFGPPAAGDGQVRVYVSGAVQHPGVYPLHPGDRIVDAVEAAGGAATDADTVAVNFAERIHDEEHIHVPQAGESVEPSTPAADAAGAQRVDLNRASAALLQSLPGVGATRAANIVASRQQQGPFRQPDDLRQRNLLTSQIYARVKHMIEVNP